MKCKLCGEQFDELFRDDTCANCRYWDLWRKRAIEVMNT